MSVFTESPFRLPYFLPANFNQPKVKQQVMSFVIKKYIVRNYLKQKGRRLRISCLGFGNLSVGLT